MLAHLHNGDTYARLGAGSRVAASTAWRYVREAVDVVAALADDVTTVGQRAARLAYAILDGTLVPIDRVFDQRPYYSGMHHRHAVNLQVLADPAGRLVWAAPALPGATHDLTAARRHTLIDVLMSYDVTIFADRGYQGAGSPVRTPFKRHATRPRLSTGQKGVNRAHAHIRALGERATATLKTWKILAKLRCCPRRATAVIAAILVLHLIETSHNPG